MTGVTNDLQGTGQEWDEKEAIPIGSNRGNEQLAMSIIIQALIDYEVGPRRYREEAATWLEGKTDSGMTLDHCCRIIARNPSDVHDLVSRINEGELSVSEMRKELKVKGAYYIPGYSIKQRKWY